ncbi:thioesterase [Amycolatopsis rubida]|uniref:Thioesterase n=1 Tax=Amycolatopsis rubida TaxID=112413 RepID=A0A1I6AHA3_9PSEU|nr:MULTISPECIES: alpha/beta fold hydrolase [Amycolatopsis]MYW93731.1 thioesterase [Amycolatopsis rubida]NEC58718.1 thioesterase [Amycolatopsis rubida]OAP22910.1 Linear gramicidin dehydrogenase LgrE [Amycolatopsis sp. M39]SFQ68104.1 Surfactin synthase thioesterase subunit [Amycolatopsis rubida]
MTTLYCLVHAGGTPAGYRSWIKDLSPGLKVVPVQHPRPGGGTSMTLQASARGVAEQVGTEDYAFFGHSLGAVIAFEAARVLTQGGAPPRRLFACGSAVPPVESARARDLRLLPDREFLDEIARLGGLPPAVIADAELRHEFLPGLRADYTLAETYDYQEGPPLTCPISAFRGRTDPHVDLAGLRRWHEHTEDDTVVREVPGGHFPLQHASLFLHRAIRKDLDIDLPAHR